MLSNNKWFCNRCVKLTINDIFALVTKKVRSCIQSSCDFLDVSSQVSTDPNPAVLHDGQQNAKTGISPTEESKFVYSDISEESNEVDLCTSEVTANQSVPGKHEGDLIVQKVNQCIVEKMNELKEFFINEVPKKQTYADITFNSTLGKQTTRTIPSSGGGEPDPVSDDQEKNVKVNELNSLVVRNIQERRYVKDAPSIKKEFNKYFKQCKIVSAFPTRSGALIIELPSRAEAEQVAKNWNPSYFCPSDRINQERYNTSCQIMADIKPLKVILKNVEYGLTDSTISRELSRHYPGATFQRFITRQGKPLKTGVINLTSQDHVAKVLEKDYLPLCNMHLVTQRYMPKRKVIQCYNCKQFDHVKKWCPNKYSCNNCSKEHLESDCRTPHQLKCMNCGNGHSSLDKNCPVYLHKYQVNSAIIGNQQYE